MKRLLIVGGGSAGWMAAIYLNRYFNRSRQSVDISLVESEDVGVIGVGEATVHSIRYFFAAMGLDESELLAETHATLKTGILFNNWMKPAGEKMHGYFHPFEPNGSGDGFDISTLWLQSGRTLRERYDQGVCTSSHLIEAGLTPKAKNSRPYTGLVPYGYHLDAVLLGRYLRKKAVQAGVRHIVGHVRQVETHEGNINAVELNDGSRLSADFYLDATGFNAVLMESLNSDNWHSFEDALPCNRAVALQLPHRQGQASRPYTTATALSHGWVWEIDLTTRRGTGYVYDGNALSPSEAEAELRAFLGVGQDAGRARHLAMKIGCRPEAWVGNCAAIGLSGGFIEPLESTGLHIINMGVKLLATHLSGSIGEAARQAYNRAMWGIYDDLKQFIVLHYCLTDRDDTPFWRRARESVRHCPELADKLALWQDKICEFMDLAGGYTTTFTDENYRYVLYGMGHTPGLSLEPDAAHADQVLDRQRQQAKAVCEAAMPQAALFPNKSMPEQKGA